MANMSLALKTESNTRQLLAGRATVLAQIRSYFAEQNVMSVDTSLLCNTTATDPQLRSITCKPANATAPCYLQTSPEFAMKRLLAAGSGSIYQLCKAFRDEEVGRYHQREFTMLEWYRVGFNHHQLMDDVDALLQRLLHCSSAERIPYQSLFLQHCDLDPHTASITDLQTAATKHAIQTSDAITMDKDDWLHLLLSHIIEPNLGLDRPTLVYDYPASQAALAKIRQENPPVAERFEVYVNGIELANGYHELTDAKEQHHRFVADNTRRRQLKLPELPIDTDLLKALEQGLPDCAGVALGVDRLMMLVMGAEHIKNTSPLSNNIDQQPNISTQS